MVRGCLLILIFDACSIACAGNAPTDILELNGNGSGHLPAVENSARDTVTGVSSSPN